MTEDQLELALRELAERSGLTTREIASVFSLLEDEFQMRAHDEAAE